MPLYKREALVVLGASGAAVAHTGTSAETILATVPVPGGALGPNGQLRVTVLWSVTNSANNKIFRVRLGGLSGTAFLATTLTTTAAQRGQVQIANRNAQNSQIAGIANNNAGGWGQMGGGTFSGSVDTSQNQDLVFTAELVNSAETISLESYLVELLRG